MQTGQAVLSDSWPEPVRQQLLLQNSAWDFVQAILSLKEEVQLKTVIFLWKWWNVRNKMNQKEKGPSSEEVANAVITLLGDIQWRDMKSPEKKTKMNQKWKPPPPGLLKINTDSAFVQEDTDRWLGLPCSRPPGRCRHGGSW